MGNKWTFEEYGPDIPASIRDHGTCMNCGKEDRNLVILNDDERICLECLARIMQKCNICCEHWPSDMANLFGDGMN